jgi:hypothetical protein
MPLLLMQPDGTVTICRRRRACLGLLALAVSLAHVGERRQVWGAEAARETLRLVIDYGDGSQKHFTALAWKKGMTVFDALTAAQQHPRGIRFESTGRGATLLITSIEGMKNEGGGTDARNWIYSVNGKKGGKSCAVYELQAGDTVQWKFDTDKP